MTPLGRALPSVAVFGLLNVEGAGTLVESVLDLEEDLIRVDADERQDAQDDRDHDCGHHRVFSDVLAGVV